jgi:hypothetical protein
MDHAADSPTPQAAVAANAQNAKALTQAGIEASLFGEAAEGGRNA